MRERLWARAKNLAHNSVTGRQVKRSGTGIHYSYSCTCMYYSTIVHTSSLAWYLPGLVRDATVEYGNQEAILYSQGKMLVSSRGANRLAEEEIFVSRVTLYKLWKQYQDTDRIAGTWKPKRIKLDEEQLVAIDEALADNDELTIRQLLGIIETRWPGLKVSISTVKRARKQRGQSIVSWLEKSTDKRD